MNTEKIEKLNACNDAVKWLQKQESYEQAWQDCKRGDRMLWLLGKKAGPVDSQSRKDLALCCCDEAELSLPYAGKNKEVCEKTYRAIRDYHAGKLTVEDLRAAADAAYVAYAGGTAGAAARKKILNEAADIVRKHYPEPPEI